MVVDVLGANPAQTRGGSAVSTQPASRAASQASSRRRSSISSTSSSSPPPPKKRRVLPSGAEPRQAEPRPPKPKPAKPIPLPQIKRPSYLGEFIVEAWATTSDTKSTTYIHSGDTISISRSDSDAPVRSDASTKVKGAQTKLSFAPKAKSTSVKKRNAKENNVVRFLNSKGSGLVFTLA